MSCLRQALFGRLAIQPVLERECDVLLAELMVCQRTYEFVMGVYLAFIETCGVSGHKMADRSRLILKNA